MTTMSRPEMGVDLARALQEAHRGDPAAWETLFKACYPKVRRVVRRKLNRSMRSLYDSTDFASDVMKSLAAHFDRLEFPSVDSLMAFLARVAEQKVIDEYRRQQTLKRKKSLERPISASADGFEPVQLTSDEPTPSEVFLAEETRERLTDRPDETERTIVERKAEGYSTAEVAQRTGWNIRQIQRFLKSLHDSIPGSGG